MRRLLAFRFVSEVGRQSAPALPDVRADARQAARELHNAVTYVRERDALRGP